MYRNGRAAAESRKGYQKNAPLILFFWKIPASAKLYAASRECYLSSKSRELFIWFHSSSPPPLEKKKISNFRQARRKNPKGETRRQESKENNRRRQMKLLDLLLLQTTWDYVHLNFSTRDICPLMEDPTSPTLTPPTLPQTWKTNLSLSRDSL